MDLRFFDAIDWQRPWLAPFQETAGPIIRSDEWRLTLNSLTRQRGLTNHRGLPVHFVPQEALPPGTAYEAFISATGGVPTRENLHDFFNALVWLTFPQIKIRLNALQAAEIAKSAVTASRGSVRDAATIFDENAALLVARDASMVDALRAHAWRDAFLDRRQDFGRQCEVWLFGHALMEKLVTPYKAITAHVWPVMADDTYFDLSAQAKRGWIDTAVAQQLEGGLTTADFTPLPVLGVPGWWPGQDDTFYADASVFRPKRQRLIRT